ncbi:beta-lactamase superfamily domain-containing protein [Mrakia frigida]|uniref:beta-lactamase superfamily domain-containing protein n=1 Tax=Mrakia frigida TaxID=29902 RepID=UPI003FCC10F7
MASSTPLLTSPPSHPLVHLLPSRLPPRPKLHHNTPTYFYPTQTYKNPWPSHRSPLSNLATITNAFTDPALEPHPDDHDTEEGKHPVELDVGETDWGRGKGKVKGLWLGHASFLMMMPRAGGERGGEEEEEGEVGVLFDPVFEERCSPSTWVGPIRDVEAPCLIPDLPPIHLVLISHDHYDHLSLSTITELWLHNLATLHFFVPLGLKSWFLSLVVSPPIPEERITECDWWDEVEVEVPSTKKENEGTTRLRVACTPSQHSSGRGPGSQGTTLWCSWVVGLHKEKEGEVNEKEEEKDVLDPAKEIWDGMRFKTYFAGDTGYRLYGADSSDSSSACPAFKEISSLFSPFSLLLLPISPGSSLPYLTSFLPYPLSSLPLPSPNLGILTSHGHLTPSDAVELFDVLGGGRAVGIHWGTWGGEHLAKRTRRWLWMEMRARGVSKKWKGKKKEGAFELWRVGELVVLEEEEEGEGGVRKEGGGGQEAKRVEGVEDP